MVLPSSLAQDYSDKTSLLYPVSCHPQTTHVQTPHWSLSPRDKALIIINSKTKYLLLKQKGNRKMEKYLFKYFFFNSLTEQNIKKGQQTSIFSTLSTIYNSIIT